MNIRVYNKKIAMTINIGFLHCMIQDKMFIPYFNPTNLFADVSFRRQVCTLCRQGYIALRPADLRRECETINRRGSID